MKFKSSMLPDRTLHELSVPEGKIVRWKVHEGTTQNSEVKDLVAGPAVVKLAWWAPLRTPNHVDYGALNVGVATKGVDPGLHCWHVLIHESKHNEHDSSREAQNYVHNSAHLPVLLLVKLGHQGDAEADEASKCHQWHVDCFVHEDLLAGHRVLEDGDASAKDKYGNAAIVESWKKALPLQTLHHHQVEGGRAAHAEAGWESVDAEGPHWDVIHDFISIKKIRRYLDYKPVQECSLITKAIGWQNCGKWNFLDNLFV